jgi:hypothetical protein
MGEYQMNQSIKEIHNARLSAPDRGTTEFRRETMKRLKRIETRLVGGLESLGVSPVNHADGIRIDDDQEAIHIKSLGTTVADLLQALSGRRGQYHIVYNGKIKAVFSNL